MSDRGITELYERLGFYGRAAARAPAALGWTLLSHWHLRSRQLLRRGPARQKRSLDVISRWGKGLGWIMGVQIVERNQRSGPMGDVIIANHMGFLDIPVLLSYYPAVFMIKMAVRRVPYFGRALARGGHVFVERGSTESRRSAREGLRAVLEAGDRIIVFPEGRASPGAERLPFKPFCFFEAARQGKTVEACVIDYLPDRQAVRWDIKRKTLPQLLEIIGRRRTEVSVEFFPAELVDDPEAAALRYHDLIQGRLEAADRARVAAERRPEGGSEDPCPRPASGSRDCQGESKPHNARGEIVGSPLG